jgi:hypothetical protein
MVFHILIDNIMHTTEHISLKARMVFETWGKRFTLVSYKDKPECVKQGFKMVFGIIAESINIWIKT